MVETPKANIGVSCDVSGLLVLDIDPRDGGDETLAELIKQHGELPPTLEVRTGGGGRHLYFEHPGDKRGFVKKIGPGVDVKANGYVVAPPSVHESGGVYEWSDPHAAILKLPKAWLKIVSKSKETRRARVAGAQFRRGKRNDGLASISGRLRNAGFEVADIGAFLEGMNKEICDPPLPPEEVRKIARSMGRYEKGDAPTGEIALRPFSEIERRQLSWIWAGRAARGEITLLVGDPGLGKSQLTAGCQPRSAPTGASA